MKYRILLLLFFAALIASAQQKSKVALYYLTDKWKVTRAHERTLDSIAMIFNTNADDDFKLIFHGHTDSRADSLYNINLSQRRGKAAGDYLEKLITKKPDISYFYHGENEPVADNRTSAGRAKNRRVLIEIIKLHMLEHDKGQICYKNLEELYNAISPPLQKFCIDYSRDTVIKGNEGTIIFIRANTFKPPRSYKRKCVTISLREVYTLKDMILNNLTTTTPEGEVIISEAMFYIDAMIDGLSLQPLKEITYFFPTDSIIEEAKFFTGFKLRNGLINWKLENNPIYYSDEIGQASLCNDSLLIDSVIYKMVDKRCRLFFCKILSYMGIRKPKQELDSTIIQKNVPCNHPKAIRDRFGAHPYLNLQTLRDLTDDDEIRYYIVNSSALGWGNIDWLTYADEFIDYQVKHPPAENLDMRIIFKERRSVIPLNRSSKYYHCEKTPAGYEVWVFALKVEDGKAYMAIKSAITENKGIQHLEFKEVTLEDLYAQLEKFDR